MSLKNTLQQFLDDQEWDDDISYNDETEKFVIVTDVSIEGTSYRLFIEASDKLHLLFLYLYSPIEVPPKRRADAESLANWFNCRFSLGNLEVLDDGHIRYRAAVDVENAEPSPALVTNMLGAATGAFSERRVSALGAVAFTKQPLAKIIEDYKAPD